jgi:hypothetical protein
MKNWLENRYLLLNWCWSLIRTLDALGVLVVVALLLWASHAGADDFGAAQRRDCAPIAHAYLAQMGMRLTSVPKVFTTVPITRPGWYDTGIVFVRNDKTADCGIYVHEFVHAYDYQQHGPATSQEEWLEREKHAVRVEMRWRGD